MRQLNNTWTLERISTFSGSPKGEKSYEFWQYKIHCLLNETSTDLIWSDSISFPQISERKSSHHPHESRTRSNNRQHHSENKLHLIHAFWDGLSSDLKDLSGYIHDTILSFDELRSELRQIVQDHERRKANKGKKVGPTVMSATHEEDEAFGMDDIKAMLLKKKNSWCAKLKDDRLQ